MASAHLLELQKELQGAVDLAVKLPAAERVLWIGQHLLSRVGLADPPSPPSSSSRSASSDGDVVENEEEAMQELVPVLQAAVNAARARPHRQCAMLPSIYC